MFRYKLLIFQKLLNSKAHLGSKNPCSNTQYFIYGFRNTIPIINLEETLICLRRACNIIDLIIQSKGHLLFVSSSAPEYSKIIKETAFKTNQSFLLNKWTGGFLTNWKHMHNVYEHFQKFQQKKNFSIFISEKNQSHYNFLKPDCIIIFNVNQNYIAINEANLLKIPIIALVDSNVPVEIHKLITYPIPANDKSVQLIYLICNCFLKTILQRQRDNIKNSK
uniref:Ribosomal protein S2 n=1 Tax=Roya anglica TaxID=43943 RepID=A0A6G9IEU1_9VIRI|nr:ribosomal protein S2 [Roya anglica]QIQ22980.1 ribosomal protein S2 [Roya anglica]